MKKFIMVLASMPVWLSAMGTSETLYLVGDPAGAWNPAVGERMTESVPGVFEIESVMHGYFGFVEKLSDNSYDWTQFNASRYGASYKDEPAVTDGPNTMYYPSTNSWKVESVGKYRLSVDTNTGEFTMTQLEDQPGWTLTSYDENGNPRSYIFDVTDDDAVMTTFGYMKKGYVAVSGTNYGISTSGYGAAADGTVLEPGVTVECTRGGVPFVLGHTWSYAAEFNSVDKTLTLELPSRIYVVGTLPGHSWEPDYGVALDETAAGSGIYKGTVGIDAADDEEHGYFNFSSMLCDNWAFMDDHRFAASTKNEPLATGVKASVGLPSDKTDPYAFVVTPGVYDITLHLRPDTPADNHVLITEATDTGTDLFPSDDGMTCTDEWFDLTGRKVSAPGIGVYILRRGAVVRKVMRMTE